MVTEKRARTWLSVWKNRKIILQILFGWTKPPYPNIILSDPFLAEAKQPLNPIWQAGGVGLP